MFFGGCLKALLINLKLGYDSKVKPKSKFRAVSLPAVSPNPCTTPHLHNSAKPWQQLQLYMHAYAKYTNLCMVEGILILSYDANEVFSYCTIPFKTKDKCSPNDETRGV